MSANAHGERKPPQHELVSSDCVREGILAHCSFSSCFALPGYVGVCSHLIESLLLPTHLTPSQRLAHPPHYSPRTETTSGVSLFHPIASLRVCSLIIHFPALRASGECWVCAHLFKSLSLPADTFRQRTQALIGQELVLLGPLHGVGSFIQPHL